MATNLPASSGSLPLWQTAQSTFAHGKILEAKQKHETNNSLQVSNVKFGNGLAQALKFNPASQLMKRVSIMSFQQIAETFLWAFLAQDFFSLWIPRVYLAAQRGKFEYNPDKDPKIQKKEGISKWVSKKIESLKRLNIVNATEETWRELLTGPMMLVVPTVFFVWARRTMGKRAIELGKQSFDDLHHSFMHQVQKSNIAQKGFDKVSRKELKGVVSKTLSEMFDYGSAKTQLHGKPLDLNKLVSSGDRAAIQGELKKWASDWADAVYDAERHTDKSLTKALAPLNKRLQTTILDFNRRVLQSEKTWHSTNYVPLRQVSDNLKSHKVVMKNVDSLLEDLQRWADYGLEVGKPKRNTWWGSVLETTGLFAERFGAKGMANRLFEVQKRHQWNVTGSFSENAEQLKTKLIGKKMGLQGVLAVMMTLYLYNLTKWTQFSETYEANRLIRDYNKVGDAPQSPAQMSATTNMASATLNDASTPVPIQADAYKAMAEWSPPSASSLNNTNTATFAQSPEALIDSTFSLQSHPPPTSNAFQNSSFQPPQAQWPQTMEASS